MAARDRSAAESETYHMQVEADLKLAERVHRSMIPRSHRRGNLEVVCRFTPMHGIGGDYASVFFQTDTRVVASICDVTGHGIAAALLASRVSSFVLDAENTMIGIARDMPVNCSMLRVPFEPGDRLIMYTDGLTEATNAAGEFLDVAGLRRTFQDTAHLSLEDSVAGIVGRVEAFSDGLPAADDQLLLALGFLGEGVPGRDGIHSGPGGR